MLLILIYFSNIIQSSHYSFKNDCGPYKGLEDDVIMPTKEDCFNANGEDDKKCCFVEGEKDLRGRTVCLLIENTSEKRIEVIEELSQIATKLKVDCNTPKSFEQDCGSSTDPSSAKDCKDGSSGDEKCCFVKINSEQFTGKGCKKFQSIDINTIGEAVRAAKTVGAELEVKCHNTFIKLKYFIAILFCFFLI